MVVKSGSGVGEYSCRKTIKSLIFRRGAINRLGSWRLDMTAVGLPSAHHVVFAVSRERLGAVSSLFTDLGFVFDRFVLEDVGLEVMLDWARGIELVTPTRPQDHGVSQFLARNGEGVYSVVVRVGDAPSAEEVAHRHGAVTRFRQHREVGAHRLEEIELSVQGLSLTLLSADLP